MCDLELSLNSNSIVKRELITSIITLRVCPTRSLSKAIIIYFISNMITSSSVYDIPNEMMISGENLNEQLDGNGRD